MPVPCCEQLDALKKIARVGDSHIVRVLMDFLRNSWNYIKVRGNDTDIKLGVARLLFHLLAFKDNERIDYLLDALQHPDVHVERDRIGKREHSLNACVSAISPLTSVYGGRTHRGFPHIPELDDPVSWLSRSHTASHLRTIPICKNVCGSNI